MGLGRLFSWGPSMRLPRRRGWRSGFIQSTEATILLILALAIAAGLGMLVLTTSQSSSQVLQGVVTSVQVYDQKVILSVKNTGTVDITKVRVVASWDTSSWDSGWQDLTLAPGQEGTKELAPSGLNAGQVVRVTVYIRGAGGAQKVIYSQKVVVMQW